MYIIEVGYDKVYRRTYEQHLNILRNFEPTLPAFQNVWRKSLKGLNSFNAFLTDLNRSKTLLATDYVVKRLFGYNLKHCFIPLMITSQILTSIIPITPATDNKDGILFIPGNVSRFLSNAKNAKNSDTPQKNSDTPQKTPDLDGCVRAINKKNKKKNEDKDRIRDEDVVIKINPAEFDPILHDMALASKGVLLSKDTQKSNKDIQTIMYAFGDEDEADDGVKIRTCIKQFLYSLPVNVFLLTIYKKENLLFPRNEITAERMIEDEKLNATDRKIIEYGETHLRIYHKINNNVRYLVDYIKPPKFIDRLLPRYFRPPKFSP